MPAPTARDAVLAFSAALRAKDLPALLALVEDDVLLIGSEGHEVARGRDEVRALLAHVITAEASYGWDLSAAVVHERGDVAWFGVDTMLEARSASGVARAPYRLTGVLVRGAAGGWRWAHLHGSEPAPAR